MLLIVTGNSSSYCTILSQVLVTDRLRRAFPYLSQFRTGLANWWQVGVSAPINAYVTASRSLCIFIEHQT